MPIPATKERPGLKHKPTTLCYHCGSECLTHDITVGDKLFCCDGCRLVYEVINSNGLCNYYEIQQHPGLSQVKPLRSDKYAYLDQEEIASRLFKFTDGNHAIVILHVPGIHCSSCMWLLEHMHRLNPGITESRLNFSAKEITIRFQRSKISLRQVVELMTTLGYEPAISLQDAENIKKEKPSRHRIYKLGVAGFCFGNIMLMSFPEYLSGSNDLGEEYALLFRMLNLFLSIPVFFYCASEFWVNTWVSLRRLILHIDAPIALALLITYGRSLYEIAHGMGNGYLDSMSGIVFFMLAGRVVQERTYRSLSFHRDYKSYFPIAVTIQTSAGTTARSLHDLKKGDRVVLHSNELVPADSIVTEGTAYVDYSFVTGESEPVMVPEGKQVYAGGRHIGKQIAVTVLQPVSGSYLTSLWNHYAFEKNKTDEREQTSFVHLLSKYFTWILFALAGITTIYWWIHNPSVILPAVSAMLIVACPCALLLAATFTNGNLLRIFSNKGLYLRDAAVAEQLSKITHIVFDKTGTLTDGVTVCADHTGEFTDKERQWVYNCVRSSNHPYSRAITEYMEYHPPVQITFWKEIPGQGMEAVIDGQTIRIGSAAFTGLPAADHLPGTVYISIGEKRGSIRCTPRYRKQMPETIATLRGTYQVSLLSGDRAQQQAQFTTIFGNKNLLHFGKSPEQKLAYIESQQQQGAKVLMIGDGLNDAGALQQSDVGITLSDDVNNFTPSCDAILDASKFDRIPAFIKMAQAGQRIIHFAFIISILYNIIGLYIAVQGLMQPMIAAILMPSSTLSIVLISTGMSAWKARRLKL